MSATTGASGGFNFDPTPLINAMMGVMTMQMVMNVMQNTMGGFGGGGFGGITKTLEDIVPLLILFKLLDKLGQ